MADTMARIEGRRVPGGGSGSIVAMGPRPDDDLAGGRHAHERVCVLADGIDELTARRPSALPDWSVGHVLTHIARNADGIRNMVEAAARGEIGMMYPGGVEQRNADIESGAGRPAAALAADVRSACAALDAAWSSLSDAAWRDGAGRGPFGDRPVATLAFVRWREVQVHSLDLGIDAFGVDDLDPAYIDRELAGQEAAYRDRSGTAALPVAALALTPAARLAWLIGRLTVPDAGDPGRWM